MSIFCLIGVHHAQCEDNSVFISFSQNASQSCSWTLLDQFIVMKRLWGSFRTSRGTFHDYSHVRISCLFGVQHARCEDNSVSNSFPQSASQSCCLTLLDHFVIIKRQRGSYSSSREAFYDYSHMTISCLNEVQHARCKEMLPSNRYALHEKLLVMIRTRNLLFDWSTTCSVCRNQREHLIPTK